MLTYLSFYLLGCVSTIGIYLSFNYNYEKIKTLKCIGKATCQTVWDGISPKSNGLSVAIVKEKYIQVEYMVNRDKFMTFLPYNKMADPCNYYMVENGTQKVIDIDSHTGILVNPKELETKITVYNQATDEMEELE